MHLREWEELCDIADAAVNDLKQRSGERVEVEFDRSFGDYVIKFRLYDKRGFCFDYASTISKDTERLRIGIDRMYRRIEDDLMLLPDSRGFALVEEVKCT